VTRIRLMKAQRADSFEAWRFLNESATAADLGHRLDPNGAMCEGFGYGLRLCLMVGSAARCSTSASARPYMLLLTDVGWRRGACRDGRSEDQVSKHTHRFPSNRQ
jgi:hypothetical protein